MVFFFLISRLFQPAQPFYYGKSVDGKTTARLNHRRSYFFFNVRVRRCYNISSADSHDERGGFASSALRRLTPAQRPFTTQSTNAQSPQGS